MSFLLLGRVAELSQGADYTPRPSAMTSTMAFDGGVPPVPQPGVEAKLAPLRAAGVCARVEAPLESPHRGARVRLSTASWRSSFRVSLTVPLGLWSGTVVEILRSRR